MTQRIIRKVRPTAAQIARVRASEQRHARAAVKALNAGDTARFKSESEEAAVCGSWLRTYAD